MKTILFFLALASCVNAAITLPTVEGTVTFGEGGDNATHTWTWNLPSGTPPVVTITNGVFNLSTGALQVGGVAIAPSANGSSLLAAANYAAMRALLDLEAGTDFLSVAATAAAYQSLDADLTDLADGSLTGTKVGTGINGDNITSGTVADARIASTLARDGEAVTGSVAAATLDASGFNGNLTTADNTIQEVAQKLDDLVAGEGSVDEAANYIWTGAHDFTAATLDLGALSTTTLTATTLTLGVPITTSGEELNFVDGVTSSIQTQLDAKLTAAGTATLTNKTLTAPAISSPTVTGTPVGIPATNPAGITGADAVTNIVSLTQAEYDAIGAPSATTLYVITD